MKTQARAERTRERILSAAEDGVQILLDGLRRRE
jgi:hypothetical protein